MVDDDALVMLNIFKYSTSQVNLLIYSIPVVSILFQFIMIRFLCQMLAVKWLLKRINQGAGGQRLVQKG